MSTESAKLTFSLGAGATNLASSSAPVSNLERLLAQSKSNGASTSSARPVKSKLPANIFGDEDDEDRPSHAGPSLAGPSRPSNSQGNEKKTVSRAERRAQAEALKVDSTVFDYDAVYDGMKAAERKIEDEKKAETAERKPKYTESFLAAAQTRKLDRLRAEEKMLQLEREKEGDEFKDKDKFVTEAYKRQMEEVRKAEEEEKIREGESCLTRYQAGILRCLDLEEIRKSKKGSGLSALYSTMLDDDSKRHDAAVAASHGSVDSGPSLAIRPPTQEGYEPEAEYDPVLAQEERRAGGRQAGSTSISEDTGKEVEVNDEGDVVDKRSLLKAGLNIMKKPKTGLPNSLLTSQRSGQVLEGPYKSRAVGTAATYQERIERERKRLAEEMRLDAERKKAAEEEAMRAEEEAVRRRREGNDGDAQKKREEARERFLARKRAREEEDAEKSRKKANHDGL